MCTKKGWQADSSGAFHPLCLILAGYSTFLSVCLARQTTLISLCIVTIFHGGIERSDAAHLMQRQAILASLSLHMLYNIYNIYTIKYMQYTGS